MKVVAIIIGVMPPPTFDFYVSPFDFQLDYLLVIHEIEL
jgi:hypothetical protein